MEGNTPQNISDENNQIIHMDKIFLMIYIMVPTSMADLIAYTKNSLSKNNHIYYII